MKNNNKNWKSFQILIILFFSLQISNSLTIDQIVNKCHCDLIQQFCDFECCCDLDCSSSISQSCFNKNSYKYCPRTQFFYSLKGNIQQDTICLYYNKTQIIIQEQQMTNSQRNQFINANKDILPVSSTLNSRYKGYKLSSILKIGGISKFSLLSTNGDCLTTVGTANFNFKFGNNIKLSCKSTSSAIPLIFSSISGKSVEKFLDISQDKIFLPSLTASISTVKINFILGIYGSQKIKYIDRMTYTTSTDLSSSTKTLIFNFIDPAIVQKQQNSASFFPQIPIDMFYPIHMMS